eukprot:scaffold96842_cov69-Phaeocystis_antarctica.AAC.2
MLPGFDIATFISSNDASPSPPVSDIVKRASASSRPSACKLLVANSSTSWFGRNSASVPLCRGDSSWAILFGRTKLRASASSAQNRQGDDVAPSRWWRRRALRIMLTTGSPMAGQAGPCSTYRRNDVSRPKANERHVALSAYAHAVGRSVNDSASS